MVAFGNFGNRASDVRPQTSTLVSAVYFCHSETALAVEEPAVGEECRGQWCNLLQHAVVEFLLAPVGCGLHEGQDQRVWFFFG